MDRVGLVKRGSSGHYSNSSEEVLNLIMSMDLASFASFRVLEYKVLGIRSPLAGREKLG